MNDKTRTATKCPLCGADNQCAVAAGGPPETCWCFSVQLGGEAMEKAAAITESQCICPACGQPTEKEVADEG